MMIRRCLGLLLFLGLATPAAAQQTAADSARVLLDAARVLDRQGQGNLARELRRVLRNRWPDTPAAREAGGVLATAADEPVSGLGRTGFIAYHTALGAWFGVAIPAALGADDTEPYGAGLLIGAPAGFIGSRAYARRHAITDGQAGVISFASQFGMWQAVGWASVLNIGGTEDCFENYCYENTPERRPFTASVIGAAAGLTAGVLISQRGVAPGTSTFVAHSGYWGTWLGYAASVIGGSDDYGHSRLTAALVGSAAGVALAVPLARTWHPDVARVRIISAGGLAGGLAGVGVALLTNTDQSEKLVGLILGGNVAGMVVAGTLTRDRVGIGASSGGDEAPAAALLTVRDHARFGVPAPLPTIIHLDKPVNGKDRVLGVKLPLLDVRF